MNHFNRTILSFKAKCFSYEIRMTYCFEKKIIFRVFFFHFALRSLTFFHVNVGYVLIVGVTILLLVAQQPAILVLVSICFFISDYCFNFSFLENAYFGHSFSSILEQLRC